MLNTSIGSWEHLSWMDHMGYMETRQDKINAVIADLVTAKHCGVDINRDQEQYFRKHGINMDSLTDKEVSVIRNEVNRH